MTDQLRDAEGTRQKVQVKDLTSTKGYPVDKFQPNGLPALKEVGLSEDVITKLQGPAAMLDF